jgi:DNA-binding NarL/FixJ family response regulator
VVEPPWRRGASNCEIALDLFIGAATVKSHVSSILTKLGRRDRTQIVVFAYESGLVKRSVDTSSASS